MRRPVRRAALATAVVAGVLASAVVAPGPVAHAGGTPPTVQLDVSNGPQGASIEVTVDFTDPCTTAGAVLTNTSSGNSVALSGFFDVENGTGVTTLEVPADAYAGAYAVSVLCVDPVGPQATVPFQVTGQGAPTSSVQLSPTEGPAGTTIDVALAFEPPDACPDLAAVALHSSPSTTSIVALDIPLEKPSSGPYHGTLHVPNDTPADTALYVIGGCASPQIFSAPQQFVVTSSVVVSAQWWKRFHFLFDKGAEGLLLLLTPNPPLPLQFPGTTTTTLTTAPAPPTTVAPGPTPGPGSSTSSTTTTTDPNAPCPPNCKP
jgi:hypothetical protein